jgi:hypothetical protein
MWEMQHRIIVTIMALMDPTAMWGNPGVADAVNRVTVSAWDGSSMLSGAELVSSRADIVVTSQT